jgi:hypothetical protein
MGRTSVNAEIYDGIKAQTMYLKLTNFPLTSINIHWDNITHITLAKITIEEGLDVLRRAPSLEYYHAVTGDSHEISAQMPILHPRLRSLDLFASYLNNVLFLDAISLPSLEEWTQGTKDGDLPVAAMLSFIRRSGCPLKVFSLDVVPWDLRSLLQALPLLEHLRLCCKGLTSTTVMDDILTRVFRSVLDGSDISEDPPSESFLPNLRFIECWTTWAGAPFSWDLIPQLYLQGHRQSLMLTCAASDPDIKDDTAFRLLQLVDQGFNLQIREKFKKGDFLENFRNRMARKVVRLSKSK